MRDLWKRLEALEARGEQREPLRVVRQIIGCRDGQALPWNPTRAKCRGETIARDADETPEAFQTRALAHFTGPDRVIIGA